MTDERLAHEVATAHAIGSGIGGAVARLDVAGAAVFVKRIPLSDLERRHPLSTANLFDLPAFCQYGVGEVGSPGFGAWRELAANRMATDWVLAGRTAAFPLLHHWRVLPGAAAPPAEHADLTAAVAYWGGAPGVGDRLRARAAATASIVLFQEYVPWTLDTWLHDRSAAGPDALAAAVGMVCRALVTDVGFMNDNELLHFDAHFSNVLTDGRRLYFADLGLATSPAFALSADERAFVAHHATHDRCYTQAQLVNWLVTHAAGVPDTVARNDYVRACAAGAAPAGLPAPLAAVVSRYARVAVVFNDFFWDLWGTSRTTPYPAADAAREIEVASRLPPS
ncbi:serine/threonine protein phosphatase [Asanoa sp. NPDC049518]|uniref:serine/threonine protein phosphatase n=1 Tax=unclassified Asanoa TaxID=2685164 RepID=UPI00342C7ED4